MPFDGSAGYSEETPRKQDHFRYFIRTHLRIVKTILAKGWPSDRYFYCDLTAGPGMVNGREGSPLIFVDEAYDAGVEWNAAFCESEREAALSLKGQLQSRCPEILLDHSGFRIYPTDHGACLQSISDQLREDGKPVYGLIYVDPNGSLLPIEAVRLLTQDPAFSRVDVLCYVSATNYKRFRGVWPDRPHLTEDLEKIGKRYVHIRQPYRQHQWVFVFLTNWPGYPELRNIGFHRIDSPQGKLILDRLDRTAAERCGQQEIDSYAD